VKPYEENIVTFTAMFDGYSGALARFEIAAKQQDGAAAYVPLFEALNWAVVLDDRTAAHFEPEGKPLGFAWRDRVAGADLMRGVRFARNSIHHDWSDALRLDTGGMRFPMTFPVVFFEWTWCRAADLAKRGKADAEGEAVYGEALEGQPVRHTLTQLGLVFSFLRALLEPFT
jgi:hypothetical protein